MHRTLILAAAVFVALSAATFAEDSRIPPAKDALTVIHARKSVRLYTEQAVTEEQIETLLRAAMAAPSGVDRRPWVFVVITDAEVKNTLAEKLPYAKMLAKAPVGIVVCGDIDKDTHDLWQLDCAMAAENLLLAAEAIGLGAVYTALYPDEERIAVADEALGLPENIVPLALIPVGYPAADAERPKDKWNPELVHWQRWGGTDK